MTPVPTVRSIRRSFRSAPRAGAGVTALFLGMLALSGLGAALVGHAGTSGLSPLAELASPAQARLSMHD